MNKWISSLTALMILISSSLLAQDGSEPLPPRDQGAWQMFIVLAIGLLFFYFILWRPEQKRRKLLEDQRNALKKGDRVTAMGIIGTLVRVQEHTVVLRMIDGSKIEFLKAAISDVQSGTEEDAKKVEKED